jgi:hypothetical protein
MLMKYTATITTATIRKNTYIVNLPIVVCTSSTAANAAGDSSANPLAATELQRNLLIAVAPRLVC